ncbi:MAG: hypothetical protein ACFB13_08455 [Kiloniellaceae bacterium]
MGYEDDISPYLMRPLRSLEEVLLQRRARYAAAPSAAANPPRRHPPPTAATDTRNRRPPFFAPSMSAVVWGVSPRRGCDNLQKINFTVFLRPGLC